MPLPEEEYHLESEDEDDESSDNEMDEDEDLEDGEYELDDAINILYYYVTFLNIIQNKCSGCY